MASVYRVAPAAALRRVPLDAFTAIYHRESGLTHLVTAPAPEIMDLLADTPMTGDALLAALAARFDIPDLTAAALQARLDELAAAGLVATA